MQYSAFAGSPTLDLSFPSFGSVTPTLEGIHTGDGRVAATTAGALYIESGDTIVIWAYLYRKDQTSVLVSSIVSTLTLEWNQPGPVELGSPEWRPFCRVRPVRSHIN